MEEEAKLFKPCISGMNSTLSAIALAKKIRNLVIAGGVLLVGGVGVTLALLLL